MYDFDPVSFGGCILFEVSLAALVIWGFLHEDFFLEIEKQAAKEFKDFISVFSRKKRKEEVEDGVS